MGSLAVSTIAAEVRNLIQDDGGTRVSPDEMLRWINDGILEIVNHRPDAYVKNASIPLAAGTKQSIPSDGIILVGIVRMMGVSGGTPGKSLRRVDRGVLDETNPNWHTLNTVAEPTHFIYDDIDPKTFYVFPPADGTTQVEAIYSAAPVPLTSLDGIMPIDDTYKPALTSYVSARCLSKDDQYMTDGQAANHYRVFLASMGKKEQGDMAASTPKEE